MIIKSNLVKFIKNTYGVKTISYRKLYTYGKGENKYFVFSFTVDGVSDRKELYGEINAFDIIKAIENLFSLNKIEKQESKIVNRNLNNLFNKFSVLILNTEDIYKEASKAYHEGYFGHKAYSDISKLDKMVDLLSISIKSKKLESELVNYLKEINIQFSETDIKDKDFWKTIKAIYEYYKFILSKDEYRLILVTASRLHRETTDDGYCGSNFKSYIKPAINTVKKLKLKAEDEFKFQVNTWDHKSWSQDGCCGFSSIDHREWTEELVLFLNGYEEHKIKEMNNCSAYGHY